MKHVLKNSKVAVRLPALIGICLTSTLVIGVLAIVTLSQVKVGGSEYQRSQLKKDLFAEVSPAAATLDRYEEILLKAELDDERGNFVLTEERGAELDTAAQLYIERNEFWLENLNPDLPPYASMAEAYDYGKQYIAAVEQISDLLWDGVPLSEAVELVPRQQLIDAHDAAIAEAMTAAKLEATAVTEASRQTAVARLRLMTTLLIVTLVVAIAAAVVLTRSIVGPLRDLRSRLAALASGTNSDDEPLDDQRGDEFGGIAAAVNAFADRLAVEAEKSASDAQAAEQRAATVETAAAAAAHNINEVAEASTELAGAASEIAKSAGEASATAADAVHAATNANELMTRLSTSSEQINDVVNSIRNIAAQTTMLSLNATIEAARAGEAGRGFAVVASEVKDLAAETDSATAEIVSRVDQIHSDTEAALQALDEVTHVINNISSSQSVIAAAVEEQAATTAEMDRGLGDAVAAVDQLAGAPADTVSEARPLSSV